MTFRLYAQRPSRTVRFLQTVRVTTWADAVECCRLLWPRLRRDERFRIRYVATAR